MKEPSRRKFGKIPRSQRRLTLQWHITERCNRRCRHCYQEGYAGDEELPFEDLLNILQQFKALVEHVSRKWDPLPFHGYINVSGGEPFIRKDFLDLLEIFSANSEWLGFGVLTNGTFIDAKTALRLRELGASNVQVSIEGTKERNDDIRGPGAYDQTVSALKHLTKERLPTSISFTAQRSNYHEFVDVARFGRELGVSRVWSDRLIPWGNSAEMTDEVLSPEETREFFEIMHKAHGESAQSFCQTEIYMRRGLQFLVAAGRPYRCGAGNSLITRQPNGDLLPCRRMPICVGNVMETPLIELYEESDLFRSLRDEDRISEGCEECSFAKQCRGGLKCLSYALTGDPFKADPGCWLAERKPGRTSLSDASTPNS